MNILLDIIQFQLLTLLLHKPQINMYKMLLKAEVLYVNESKYFDKYLTPYYNKNT
jgi:hypothetical protein